MKMIAGHVEQDRINLSSAFSYHERGGSRGTIEGRLFFTELASAKIDLKRNEEDLLTLKYEINSGR